MPFNFCLFYFLCLCACLKVRPHKTRRDSIRTKGIYIKVLLGCFQKHNIVNITIVTVDGDLVFDTAGCVSVNKRLASDTGDSPCSSEIFIKQFCCVLSKFKETPPQKKKIKI